MWRNQTYNSDNSGLKFEKCKSNDWQTSNSIRTSICPTRCGRNCDMSAPKFQYSLRTIRPEIPTNFHHERRLPSAPDFTFSRLTSPHLILCDDRELESGYTGNRFFTYPQFGHSSKVESTSALCDYTNNYQFTKCTDFTPLPFYHASLHGERPGSEIYPRSTGLVPSYKGHVPGMQHSYGKTFGHESVNAKRYLSNYSACMH